MSDKSKVISLKSTWEVELAKDEINPSFGFNIKGGKDQGSEVIVWRVEENSLADRAGLKPGQRIIKANNIDFNNISHHHAIKLLRHSPHLKLEMASADNYYPPVSSSQRLTTDTYLWIDRHGNAVGPPGPHDGIQNKRVISIEINPGQNLGLMIRGGFEYGLGIYVTGVDHGSVAQRAGLQRGDELLEVNGRNFTSITHDKAVQILKSSRKMTIVANYIGKIPSDNNTTSPGQPILMNDDDENTLVDLGSKMLVTTAMNNDLNDDLEFFDKDLELDFGNISQQQDIEKTTSIMGMIEEKARTVLTKSEHSRFTFYRLEYQQGFLPIQTFVRILLELLNTIEKYTLLTEVREIIRATDLGHFDELIYNKPSSQQNPPQQQQKFPPQIIQQQNPPPQTTELVPVTTQQQQPITNELYDETTFINQETNRQLLITHGDTSNVINNIQLKNYGGQNQNQLSGGSSVAPGNSCVRYKVRVNKTKPILGIAIEGGKNTPHRLPRVIDVNNEGSACLSSLKAGQVLLSVDGKKLDGLSHEEIARLILDCYVDMSKPQIEFVVVETKSSFHQHTSNHVSSGG